MPLIVNADLLREYRRGMKIMRIEKISKKIAKSLMCIGPFPQTLGTRSTTLAWSPRLHIDR